MSVEWINQQRQLYKPCGNTGCKGGPKGARGLVWNEPVGAKCIQCHHAHFSQLQAGSAKTSKGAAGKQTDNKGHGAHQDSGGKAKSKDATGKNGAGAGKNSTPAWRKDNANAAPVPPGQTGASAAPPPQNAEENAELSMVKRQICVQRTMLAAVPKR